MNTVNEELRLYIEQEIIPRYDHFDAAHQRDHVEASPTTPTTTKNSTTNASNNISTRNTPTTDISNCGFPNPITPSNSKNCVPSFATNNKLK